MNFWRLSSGGGDSVPSSAVVPKALPAFVVSHQRFGGSQTYGPSIFMPAFAFAQVATLSSVVFCQGRLVGVGEVVEVLVAERALEADRVQTHVLDVLDRGRVALGIEPLQHVPDVAAAAEEDRDAVYLVAGERGAVHDRAVVGELADAED